MLRTSLTIINPSFKEKESKFISLQEYTKNISKNKAYEFQTSYYNRYWFAATIDLQWYGEDHAGPELELCILGYTFRCKLYDKRHWNYDEGRWMTEEEQAFEFSLN